MNLIYNYTFQTTHLNKQFCWQKTFVLGRRYIYYDLFSSLKGKKEEVLIKFNN